VAEHGAEKPKKVKKVKEVVIEAPAVSEKPEKKRKGIYHHEFQSSNQLTFSKLPKMRLLLC